MLHQLHIRDSFLTRRVHCTTAYFTCHFVSMVVIGCPRCDVSFLPLPRKYFSNSNLNNPANIHFRIMTIFYVYLNGTYIIPSLATINCVLLTCDSRYVADELFRKLPTVQLQTNVNSFESLSRKTPQFWYFNTTDESQDPGMMILNALSAHDSLSEFRLNVMPKILTYANDHTRSWPIIPIVPGPDWVHNGVYFIRDKRLPNRYWNFVMGRVYVSSTNMSRFKIIAVAFAEEESKVLIRSDLVRIHPLIAGAGNFLDVGEDGDMVLRASLEAGKWTFGELLGGFKEGGTGAIELTWSDDGDDWELC